MVTTFSAALVVSVAIAGWTLIGWWQGAARAGLALAAGITGFLVARRWSGEIAEQLAPQLGWRVITIEAVSIVMIPLLCMAVLGLGGGVLVAPPSRHLLGRLVGAVIALGTMLILTNFMVGALLDVLPKRNAVAMAVRDSEWIDLVQRWAVNAPTAMVITVALVVVPAAIWLPATRTGRRRKRRREAALALPPTPPAPIEPRSVPETPLWPPSSAKPESPADGPTAPIWRPEPAPIPCSGCGSAMTPTDRFCPRCGRPRTA